MRISDWSSDVCSSDLRLLGRREIDLAPGDGASGICGGRGTRPPHHRRGARGFRACAAVGEPRSVCRAGGRALARGSGTRSEEHTSELQSLMRISYAVFCLKKKKKVTTKREIVAKMKISRASH